MDKAGKRNYGSPPCPQVGGLRTATGCRFRGTVKAAAD
jgi:hypothetical protein